MYSRVPRALKARLTALSGFGYSAYEQHSAQSGAATNSDKNQAFIDLLNVSGQ